jgi:biofilm PGA synthesis N-glycosyltransferase PgaC
LITLFAASVAFLLATYVGYPLAMMLRARFAPRPVRLSRGYVPHVSCVVAAHDEGERLVRKVENLLAQSWPAERLQVVIADDGSRDGSPERARALDPARVRVASCPVRTGKPEALRRALAATSGEILVLCDARQRFEPDAVARLVEPLADPDVGAVTGKLILAGDGGVSAYWRYESLLRRCEGAVGSVMGVTGAIYAVRRSLFPRHMPADTILDDVYVPMSIVLRERRVAYADGAWAHDPELEVRDEMPRKVRTLAGNWQLLTLMPELLIPWRNPEFAPFLMHKVARLVCPFALAAAFGIAAVTPGFFFTAAFALQLALYGLALLPVLRPDAPAGRVIRVCHAFVMLNWAAVLGLWRFVRGEAHATWSTTGRRLGDPAAR